MEPLHARYPFLSAARDAVREADVDLADVVVDGGPVVSRAVERVRLAIEEGTVGEPHRSPRVELLSYPVARVLVSLVSDPRLTSRYARAEAETAMARFAADLDAPALGSVDRERLSLDALLSDLDLGGGVRDLEPPATAGPAASARYGIDVATYLELAAGLSGEAWRLPHRTLDDGVVTASREDLTTLLREGIGDRVEAGLPIEVPAEIADALEEPAAELREQLADRTPTRAIDADPRPGRFPPCVTRLLDRAAAGESLPPHSRFALTGFLATAGMAEDEIVARYAGVDADEGAIRSHLAHLRDGDGAAVYPPPSCATMQAYGDCEEAIMDDLCRRIVHPVEYYERRLDGDEP